MQVNNNGVNPYSYQPRKTTAKQKAFADMYANRAAVQTQQIQQASKTGSVNESEPTKTLEEFKREFYDRLSQIRVSPSQSQTQFAVSITDEGFEKMMNDPELMEANLSAIQRDWGYSYPPGWAPSYVVVEIGADGEYCSSAYGSAFEGVFSDAQPNSFWEKNTRNSSSDYDDFSKRRSQAYTEQQKAAAKKRAEELYQERKRLEKEDATQEAAQSAMLNKTLRVEA